MKPSCFNDRRGDRNRSLSNLELRKEASFLRRCEFRKIAKLPNFRKLTTSYVPDRINESTTSFVRGLFDEMVRSEANDVYQKSKQILGFRRREIEKGVIPGSCFIATDLFRYELDVEQNPKDPSESMVTRKIFTYKERSSLPANFDDVFSFSPEQFVVPLEGELDFDDLVERFEDIEEDKGGALFEDEDEAIIRYRTTTDLLIILDLNAGELILEPSVPMGVLDILKEAEIGMSHI